MARSRKNKIAAGSKDFDPTRWAHAVFAVGALLSAWMFSHLIEDSWDFVWSQWPHAVPRPTSYLASSIGIGLGLVVAVLVWRVERYFRFICEVAVEVSQITWPTRAETRAATIVVVVVTFICSLLLWGMDTFWSQTTDYLYGL